MDNSRRMIYPYTYAAKFAHFPYKYYWQHSIGFKYFAIGFLLTIPLFIKIDTLVNSPANVAAFEARKKKEHEDHLKHAEHLL